MLAKNELYEEIADLFICLFVWFDALNASVNSYGHVGMVSSPYHTFLLGKFDYAVNQYFVHILSLVSDKPRSAVGNVSGYRCVSDCRSRGREFDPGPVPYFRGD